MPTATITAEDLFAAARVVAAGVDPADLIRAAEIAHAHCRATRSLHTYGDGSLAGAAGSIAFSGARLALTGTSDPRFFAAMRDLCAALVARAEAEQVAA